MKGDPQKEQASKRQMTVAERQSVNITLEEDRPASTSMDNFDRIMANNKHWAKETISRDPYFFKRLVEVQKPQYLWIGCSDSRVPSNQIVGLIPGELFVHRNIANMAPLSDINSLAVIQYAVDVLKVKDVIVTGHYGCGGIKAAFRKYDHGPLEAWLSYIRDLRAKYRRDLKGTDIENENLLVELNVKQQIYNIARVPVVQKAWKKKQEVRIHGLVYRLEDGVLKDLGITIKQIEQLPEEYRIIQ